MSRPLPSATLEVAVRQHFGLSQAELARYLEVSAGLVAHLEANRRRPSRLADQRLARLAQLLPPPEGTGEAAPAAGQLAPVAAPVLAAALPSFGRLAARPLQRRHQQVLAQAARLRWALHRASKGAGLQQRRQWGLAVLQATLPHWAVDAAERAHLDRWLAGLAADVAAATPNAATSAERALVVVRLLALDLEAAALTRLLADG